MPPVPQHVLNWLYSVLTSEYHDVNRTYGDVAQALAQYPTLSPRTDVHTFENGTSALLLHLSGTLPVVFRGTTYRFPVSIRLPYPYPKEPPLVYITPTETMMVRPGQHVDPQGQVYHPYLAGWSTFWDKSTILDFLAILRDVFAKEPPVIARQDKQPASPAVRQQQVQAPTPTPPPIPSQPPELAGRPSSHPQSPQMSGGPPPPPPKTTGEEQPHAAPPRPPPPPGPASSSPQSTGPPPPAKPSRYESAPPLPHEAQQYQQASSFQQGQPGPSPSPHVNNFLQRQQLPPAQATPGSPGPTTHDPRRNSIPPPGWQPPAPSHQQPPVHPHPPQQQHLSHPQAQPQLQPHPEALKPKGPLPPNLLDEPLTLSIPSSSTANPAVAAPPIPPNPEKDMLLRQLAQTLHAYRQRSRQQNESSLAGLRAQRTAMSNASAALQSETDALANTSTLLDTNASILRDALVRGDQTMENSRAQTAPDVDELLVAPTVVANQLYSLVAEERAMGDAIFVLGRAVERGRVTPAVFAKTTRQLAREWYLKKALARKVARGMGLTTT